MCLLPNGPKKLILMLSTRNGTESLILLILLTPLEKKFCTKSTKEFMNGRNLVLLIPRDTAYGSFAAMFYSSVAFIEDLGLVTFDGYD